MKEHYLHFMDEIHHFFDRDDDFEWFLFVLTFGLFILLFIRVLIAIYMGHWGLFE